MMNVEALDLSFALLLKLLPYHWTWHKVKVLINFAKEKNKVIYNPKDKKYRENLVEKFMLSWPLINFLELDKFYMSHFLPSKLDFDNM